METFVSAVSGQEFPVRERVGGGALRDSLLQFIRKEHPDFTANDFLALEELNHFREMYIANYLSGQLKEVTNLENSVLKAITQKATLSDKLNDSSETGPPTFGQRLADKVASFGGSWTFILSFAGFLCIWIAVNVFVLARKAFDPYPFILLNLLLSCIAAIQAPIIMMSQNRQEEKDRERSKNDYMVNLKSELEIRSLHEKIDHLILNQQQELLEIQKVQIEMMNDILHRLENGSDHAGPMEQI